MIAVFSEIHAVSRPEIDAAFKNPAAYAFNLRKIAVLDAGNTGRDFCSGLRVQIMKPSGKRTPPIKSGIFSLIAIMTVTYLLPNGKSINFSVVTHFGFFIPKCVTTEYVG